MTEAQGRPLAIHYESVRKQYGSKTAVAGLSLNLEAGKLTALLGENGAGKTTAVSMALGLVKPTSGTVMVAEEEAGSFAARSQVGAMLQSAELPEQLTVEEHIKLFQTYYAAPMPFSQLVKMLALNDILKSRYQILSGGQKRRTQLALAICGNPRFILLDEPTVGLDVDTRHMFWAVIRSLVTGGTGVLLTTHYLEEADALADRILVMAEGSIIADGTPADIKALSGGKLIELRTDATDRQLMALPGVESVSAVGDRTQIVSHQAEATLKALFDCGCQVDDISVMRAGLETAFLNLTRKADTGSWASSDQGEAA